MMIIDELVDKYWAARFMHKYFNAAFQNIENAARSQSAGNGELSRVQMPRTGALGVQGMMNRQFQGVGQPFTPPSDSTVMSTTFSPDMMMNDLGFIFEAADLFKIIE
jgi:hypothetical protein